jgi:hypothetical protein
MIFSPAREVRCRCRGKTDFDPYDNRIPSRARRGKLLFNGEKESRDRLRLQEEVAGDLSRHGNVPDALSI